MPIAEIRLVVLEVPWNDVTRGSDLVEFASEIQAALPESTPKTGLRVERVECHRGSLEVVVFVVGALAALHKLREVVEDLEWLTDRAATAINALSGGHFARQLSGGYRLSLPATGIAEAPAGTAWSGSLAVAFVAYLAASNLALLVAVVWLAFK